MRLVELEPTTLDDCPVGLFKYLDVNSDAHLGVKTAYYQTPRKNVEAYRVSDGLAMYAAECGVAHVGSLLVIPLEVES